MDLISTYSDPALAGGASLRHVVTRRWGRSSGFTLVEAMMSLGIAAIVLAGLLCGYFMISREFRALANYLQLHSDGRYAIDRFANDMRAVSNVTSWQTNGPLVVTIPIAFDNSGVATSTKTVTYTLAQGKLKRTDSSDASTSILAANITNLTFRLYDRVGSSTTVLANSKSVQLELFFYMSLGRQQQTEDYLSARLDMRNKP